MSELSLTVSLFPPAKLKVTPDRGVALKDQEPTIRWKSSANISITYIGFADPVGGSFDIGIPHEDPANPGEWIATNQNNTTSLYSYTVFAERTSDGVVISSDPQIENEGKSGAAGTSGS